MYQRRLQIPLTSSLLMVLYTEISELFCTSFRLALVSKILLKTLSECESRIVGRSPNYSKKKLVKCTTGVARLCRASIHSGSQNRPSPKVQLRTCYRYWFFWTIIDLNTLRDKSSMKENPKPTVSFTRFQLQRILSNCQYIVEKKPGVLACGTRCILDFFKISSRFFRKKWKSRKRAVSLATTHLWRDLCPL